MKITKRMFGLMLAAVMSLTSLGLTTVLADPEETLSKLSLAAIESSPTFSAIPDDFNEYGVPIFYITVSAEEWEETFFYHPFFQGLTEFEDAIFRLPSIEQRVADFCPRCGQRTAHWEREWDAAGTYARNCPAFTVAGGTASQWSDILAGWAWIERHVCRSCGYRTNPIIDWNSRRWIINCNNGMEISVDVIAGSSIRHGVRPNQAVSVTRDLVVHGHNCSPFLDGCRINCFATN